MMHKAQMMHKAEKKFEMDKLTDLEEAKQRQFQVILNKLTPQNFEKLFQQVKTLNIDNVVTIVGLISQIFEKALMEPTFCETYVNFYLHLAAELPDFTEENEKITFKRLLLNKCQEEFERGEKEQEEADKAADEGSELKMTNEQRKEKRTKARRLGNIRLIGELYKKKMLTERIMHECIKKLLGHYQQFPDEEDIEALCMLMSTIGEMIDHPKAQEHMDAYFERIRLLSNNMNLSSRVRFVLKDVIDLRKNKWQQRRKVEGPKEIEEVHRDASQEKKVEAGFLGHGRGNNSTRRNTRQSYEARSLSIPLLQRPLGDDSISLGPQNGLARGMSIRGATVVSSSTALNGYGNLSNHAPYSSRENLAIGTDGSIVFSDHAKQMADELGRPVHPDELFEQTHIWKGTDEFVDERPRRTHEEYEARISPVMSNVASCPDDSESTPIDPIEEERLRNQCWIEAAGAKKGRIYEIGNLGHAYLQGDISFMKASSSRSQELEEMIHMRQRLSASEETARWALQAQERLERRFQSFVDVVLSFLPADARTVVQNLENDLEEEKEDDQEQQHDDQQQQDDRQQQAGQQNSPAYSDY